MCGIYFIFAQKSLFRDQHLIKGYDSIIHRGPDDSKYGYFFNHKLFAGFHRLAIMDPKKSEMQPYYNNNNNKNTTPQEVVFMCNGEIYNYRNLSNTHIPKNSGCDTRYVYEYLKNKNDTTPNFIDGINNLDGVFALTMISKDNIRIARDPFGVRPLFYKHWYSRLENQSYMAVASEAKALVNIPTGGPVSPFPPGTVLNVDTESWTFNWHKYYDLEYQNINKGLFIPPTYEQCKLNIKSLLIDAVKKRLHADRGIGFLCSGGLDSSIIIAIASMFMEEMNLFSIGFKDSPDLRAANKMVSCLRARGIKVNFHEIEVSKQKMLGTIDAVIRQNESFDITTTRASVPNYIIAEYIKLNTPDIKVIFSGEGADELFGGYLYFHYAPNPEEFQKETIRLTKDLYLFDILRSDRTTSIHGLEVRIPFLDKKFVRYVCDCTPPQYKMASKKYNCYNTLEIEKFILRESFAGILPHEILYRQKDAFSDAVGYNWLDEFKKYCELNINDEKYERAKKTFYSYHCKPKDKTEFYIRDVYEKYYTNQNELAKYIWRPRWTTETEPSATKLNIHSSSSLLNSSISSLSSQ